jgi:hypothetical protein
MNWQSCSKLIGLRVIRARSCVKRWIFCGRCERLRQLALHMCNLRTSRSHVRGDPLIYRSPCGRRLRMMVYDLTIWSWPYAQPERRDQRIGNGNGGWDSSASPGGMPGQEFSVPPGVGMSSDAAMSALRFELALVRSSSPVGAGGRSENPPRWAPPDLMDCVV